MQAPLHVSTALLLLAAFVPAQVPAGVCIVTQASGVAQPGIAFLDPLTGRVTPVLDPQQILPGTARAALGVAAGGDLLLGLGTASGADGLFRVKLAGNGVVAVTGFAGGLTGTITSLQHLRGAGFAVGTSTGLFRTAATGGPATPIVPAALGYECRDLALAGNN